MLGENEHQSIPHNIHKNNLKWAIDFDLKARAIKLQEKKKQEEMESFVVFLFRFVLVVLREYNLSHSTIPFCVEYFQDRVWHKL
jgi:hypothetical protein